MDDFSLSAEDALANVLCSQSVTSSIRSLRTLGVEDSVVAVALFAGLRTLLRDQPNRESWAALLLDTAAELCVHG